MTAGQVKVGASCVRRRVSCPIATARHDAVMHHDRFRGCQRVGDVQLAWRHGELVKLADRLHAARWS